MHTTLVRPDVVIRRSEAGFEAEVMENKKYLFRVNPTYCKLITTLDPAQSSEEDRQHIRQYTSRAQFFIDCIHQAWETLKKFRMRWWNINMSFWRRVCVSCTR